MKELSEYQKKLLDPKWQKKRLEILERDEFTCRCCAETEKTLHVHHLIYRRELKNPWDYPNNLLVTLCEDCHSEENEYKKLVKEILFDLFTELSSKTACELYHAIDPSYFIAYKLVDNELDGYRKCIQEIIGK